jgi:CHAD domain-containing protein
MLRAALRLVRSTSPDVYAAENPVFRDAADRLSGLRDSSALNDALNYLQERMQESDYADMFSAASAGLRNIEAEAFGGGDSEIELRCLQSAADLRDALTRFELLALEPISREQLKYATNSYLAKFARAFAAALAEPSAERLHELRKQAKNSHYHARLVGAVRRRWSARYREPLGTVGSLLGHWRDLYMLEKLAEAKGNGSDAGGHWALLQTLIPDCRRQLWSEASALCRDSLAV